MKKWLIIGITIRIIIIPITYHPDLNLFFLGNYLLLAKQMWVGFYDFLGSSSDPLAMVQPPTAFTYPPLAILSSGLFANVLYRLVDLDWVREVILDPGRYVGSLEFSGLLFLSKLHLLVADLGVGLLLYQLVKTRFYSENLALKSFALWMLNPITLYATFAIGQFDIYPVFFMTLAVWLVNKSNIKYKKLNIEFPPHYLAAFSLGIGGAFKLFPLLFLPFLISGYGKSVKEKLKIALTGGLGYLIPILPYLPSSGFRNYALLAPQTDKMLFARISVSGAEYLSLFLIGYVVLWWWWFKFCKDTSAQTNLRLPQSLELWKPMATVLLLFFSVTHFHPQWFVWVSPWLILMLFSPFYQGRESPQAMQTTQRVNGGHLLNSGLVMPITVLLLCYLILVTSFESTLNWGIFVWNQGAPDLMTFLPQFMQLEKFKYLSLIRSFFAGTSVYLIFLIFNNLRYVDRHK